jgi:hypothetical protein
MSERSHRHRWSAITTIALLAALAATGCGQEQEVVCQGQPEHLVLVPSTSKTDYDVSVEMTPEVSKQVVRRVAASCGRITVGIQNGRPEANLELHSKALISEDKKAYNAGAKTDQLVEHGEEFAQANLIEPLNATEPTGGSPFLSTMVKIGKEMGAHNSPQGIVVLVGDGLVVERPPEGGQLIRFGAEPVSPEDLAPFIPLLKSLQDSCVVLVGAGATSKLPDHRIRTSQQLLGETLEGAGVGFVATRSPDVPAGC